MGRGTTRRNGRMGRVEVSQVNHAAADLAMRGLRCFPLAPGKKYPSKEKWQEAATDDVFAAADLPPWFGVVTDGFFVLDVDAGKGGLEEFERLRSLGAIPQTFTVRSASGGLHMYFKPRAGERFRSRAYRKMADGREYYALTGYRGLDVRADGGLAVGAGSIHGGRQYRVEVDAPFAQLPEFVADLARAAAPKLVEVSTASAAPVDLPGAIDQATAYLLAAEPAIEGQGGDPHTIVVANRCMDLGVSPETTTQLMLEHWNERCWPPWDADDLQRKVYSAAKSRQTPIGRDIFDHVFDAVPDFTPPPTPTESLFEDPEEIDLGRLIEAQSRDLIRGLLSPADFAVLYGPSGSGKSFLGLHIASCISRGAPWHGHKVNRTAVLYVCAEGVRGFQKRIIAAEREYGKFGGWFKRLKIPVSLTRSEASAESVRLCIEAIARIRQMTAAENVLIVFDTLARVMAGEDENSTEAMMHFVEQRAGAIQRATGAAVLVVHHSGKNGNIRGSSALYAAAECVLRVERDGRARTLIAEKVKDGEEGPLFAFGLKPIILGRDEDGLPVTSCVVEIGASEKQRKAEGVALEILTAAIEKGIHLSPKPKARNYAGRYVFENQGNHDFSEADYAAALTTLLCGPLVSEEAKSKGKDVARVALRNNTIFDPF